LRLIKDYTNAPITRHVLLEILREYKRPNDKISELIKNGELISLRRGLYVPGPATGLPIPKSFLIANHLRGPSYVSLEAALSYWGFIPERTYEISSVTIKPSKKIKTPIGRFGYQQLPTPYYSYGIRSVELTTNQLVLLASPEKAICDKIVLTPMVNLRSIKQTRAFLLDDLRMDEHLLRTLNLEMISTWLEDAPKKSSLKMLISTLKEI
ncbi:MAG: hypothetical protein RIT43_1749, partial [Bacteroidota bacterium]